MARYIPLGTLGVSIFDLERKKMQMVEDPAAFAADPSITNTGRSGTLKMGSEWRTSRPGATPFMSAVMQARGGAAAIQSQTPQTFGFKWRSENPGATSAAIKAGQSWQLKKAGFDGSLITGAALRRRQRFGPLRIHQAGRYTHPALSSAIERGVRYYYLGSRRVRGLPALPPDLRTTRQFAEYLFTQAPQDPDRSNSVEATTAVILLIAADQARASGDRRLAKQLTQSAMLWTTLIQRTLPNVALPGQAMQAQANIAPLSEPLPPLDAGDGMMGDIPPWAIGLGLLALGFGAFQFGKRKGT